ncbi:MAG: DUF2892 domain-containing protein [bacterium]
MKNEGVVERSIQATISATLIVVAYFWLAGLWAVLAGVFAILIATFAVIGFCPLYVLFGVHRKNIDGEIGSKKIAAIVALYLLILIGGGYASNFFTKKIFVEDFNAMNASYKQTLFETGQEKRAESVKNYDDLISSYAKFQAKYAKYRPFAFKKDGNFENDLNAVRDIIAKVDGDVRTGSLKDAHLALEKVRPITQEMFKRNGFSMLAITLVDFHDSMEKVLDPANAKDAVGVISEYQVASDKLVAVEQIANDQEIQAIRANLDAVLKLAQDGNPEALPAKAAELKSSFVKVYLKRG